MAFPRLRLKPSWEYVWPDVDGEMVISLADQIASVLSPFAKKKGKSSAHDEHTCSIAKASFVLGANHVLRELERGNLCVLMFDRDFLRPSAVSEAVASLAISKSVHLATVRNLSSLIARRLGFHSLAAFGIRTSFHNAFEPFVTSLKSSLTFVSITQFGASGKFHYIPPICMRFKTERKVKAIKKR
ncbi:hypothetical protein D918_03291 [Trichuris suis]|nr:hypothetical protein D918_03291 [Trichuris suis]